MQLNIIAQTEIAKEILSKKTKIKTLKVIPNPIRKISKTNRSKNLEKKIILNVGRNVAQKNQLELIEVFSSCNYSNWVLRIIGNGHLKNKLLNKVRKLNMESNIEIIDFTKDIDKYYQTADIFALTSLYEGFPNALIEAMAHGVACISYDCQQGHLK